jgi:hypothetical protein
MKKVILISMLCLFGTLAVSAQTNEQIVIKKKRYYLNDKKLNNKELKSILLSEPESAIEYKLAKKNSTIAMVPALAGTGLVIYGTIVMLGQADDEANGETVDQSKWVTPTLIGAGLVVVSFPFIISSNSHLKKSVTIYNSRKPATGYRDVMKLDLGLTQNGVGITCSF